MAFNSFFFLTKIVICTVRREKMRKSVSYQREYYIKQKGTRQGKNSTLYMRNTNLAFIVQLFSSYNLFKLKIVAALFVVVIGITSGCYCLQKRLIYLSIIKDLWNIIRLFWFFCRKNSPAVNFNSVQLELVTWYRPITWYHPPFFSRHYRS